MNVSKSNRIPDVSLPATNIDIHFIPTSPLQLQIKKTMKSSPQLSHEHINPALFQIAARMDAPVAVAAQDSSPAPFAEIMSHPEKLESALHDPEKNLDHPKSESVVASGATHKHEHRRRTKHSSPSSKNNESRKKTDNSDSHFKRTEFRLEAPHAKNVKLAGDFTEWQHHPLNLAKAQDGAWSVNVPLYPGHYSYRYIVDGEWRDDPHSTRHVPNPFGTTNSVIDVA
jgi:Glycogen recognition site of AMP-activated protein kinase